MGSSLKSGCLLRPPIPCEKHPKRDPNLETTHLDKKGKAPSLCPGRRSESWELCLRWKDGKKPLVVSPPIESESIWALRFRPDGFGLCR